MKKQSLKTDFESLREPTPEERLAVIRLLKQQFDAELLAEILGIHMDDDGTHRVLKRCNRHSTAKTYDVTSARYKCHRCDSEARRAAERRKAARQAKMLDKLIVAAQRAWGSADCAAIWRQR